MRPPTKGLTVNALVKIVKAIAIFYVVIIGMMMGLILMTNLLLTS